MWHRYRNRNPQYRAGSSRGAAQAPNTVADDSAGLAVLHDGEMVRLRSAGRVAELAALADRRALSANIGIAHTRWATHGVPSERNAHPHVSAGLAVVHSGIIENFGASGPTCRARATSRVRRLTPRLSPTWCTTASQGTVDLFEAARQATVDLVGAHAIGVVAEVDPSGVISVRRGSPLLLGVGEDGMYAASDTAALLQVTARSSIWKTAISPNCAATVKVVRPTAARSSAMRISSCRPTRSTRQVPPLHAEGDFEQPQALAQTSR